MLALRLNPNLEVKAMHRIQFVTQTFKLKAGHSRMWGKESACVLKKKA